MNSYDNAALGSLAVRDRFGIAVNYEMDLLSRKTNFTLELLTDHKLPTSQTLHNKLKILYKPAVQNCWHAFVYPAPPLRNSLTSKLQMSKKPTVNFKTCALHARVGAVSVAVGTIY